MKKIKIIISAILFIAVASGVKGQELQNTVATDWNTIQKTGFYSIIGTPTSNSPIATNQWYWGINSAYQGNMSYNQYFNAQLAMTLSQPSQMFFRTTSSVGAGSWAKVLHDQGAQNINGGLSIGTAIGSQYDKLVIRGANQPAGLGSKRDLSFEFEAAGSSIIRACRGASWGNYMQFLTTDNSGSTPNVRLHIHDNGFVGIGTTAPDQLLTVKGKIHAQEVLIDLNGPLADYVFRPDYKLMSLHEVEQFVKTNNHLPEIPSAAQVEQNGMNLGEMQNKLLQKIEELTLYVIGLKKENQAQNDLINQLQEQLKKTQP